MTTTPKTQFAMTPSEAQAVVMDWVQATEDFHRRYFQVNQVIDNTYRGGKRQTTGTLTADKVRQTKVKNLLRIRQQMNDVLATLLGDMGEAKPGRHQVPSKPGQLIAHTRLLRDFTKDIDAELGRLNGAQA